MELLQTTITDWNFWLTLVTVLVAMLALRQTHLQIKLSNKQHLFDRRLSNYTLASSLIHLYENNSLPLMDEDADGRLSVAMVHLISLTKDIFFDDVRASDKGFGKEYGHALSKARNKLRNEALEATLIFRGKEAAYISDFILCYEEALSKLYHFIFVYDDEVTVTSVVRDMSNEDECFEDIRKAHIHLADAYATQKKCGALDKLRLQIELK